MKQSPQNTVDKSWLLTELGLLQTNAAHRHSHIRTFTHYSHIRTWMDADIQLCRTRMKSRQTRHTGHWYMAETDCNLQGTVSGK